MGPHANLAKIIIRLFINTSFLVTQVILGCVKWTD